MKPDRQRNDGMKGGGQTLAWLLGVLLIALLLGAALGPAIFNTAIRVGRNVPALEWLRDVEFERVVSRVVTVSVILLGLLTLRWSGLRGLRDVGYPRRAHRLRPVLWGVCIGVLSMALTVGLGFAMKAYALSEDWMSALIGGLIPALVGALLIGLIEEGFFRGVLFGTLSRKVGFRGGAVLSSLIFSLAHFLKPEAPYSVVYGHASSGFALAASIFSRLDFTWNSFPFSLNLFMMGMVLCVFCRRAGDVYFVAGLHAGWVWVLQTGSAMLVRTDPGHLLWLFGPTALVSKGYLALFMLTIFFIVAICMARRRDVEPPVR